MIISSTAIAYLVLTITIVFLNVRFFQYWIEKRDTTSKLFFFFGAIFLLFGLVRVVTTLFFPENTQILKESETIVAFLQGVAAAVIAYLVVYLKIPKISPWVGFISVFIIGMAVTAITFDLDYKPFLDPSGAINWGFPEVGALYPILRLFILLVAFLPLMVILFQQFRQAEEAFLKRRSLGLFLSLLLVIGVGFIDFVLNDIFRLGVIYRDYALIVLAVILFLIIFFTQKPEQLKNTNV